MDTPAFVRLDNYEAKKNHLANAIKAKASASHEKITLLKDTSNLFRHRRQHQNKIDVRAFNQVISVDKANLVAVVEGMTTFEALVEATLKYDCMPQVVPELKTITLGGALSGVGIESSSFRYGLVHETITQFEVLLPDGTIVDCRPDNVHKDLFYAFPNSYGTLGYALKIAVKLIPVKKYVKLHHLHCTTAEEFINRLTQLCHKNRTSGSLAFIEGVVFSSQHYVISTGEFVAEAPYLGHYRYMKIYYRAVEKRQEDYLTTQDYLWRWDTDWFWCSKAFKLQNPVLRFLLGKWVLKSRIYSKLMRYFNKNKLLHWLLSKFSAPVESVIQDVAIPEHDSLTFLNFFLNALPIRPFWVCPIHPINSTVQYTFFKMKPDELYLNFGFWDTVPTSHEPGFYNRMIEKKVMALNGNKSLYSNVFYTEQEFWKIYDKEKYTALKTQYDPDQLLSNLYIKCVEKTL